MGEHKIKAYEVYEKDHLDTYCCDIRWGENVNKIKYVYAQETYLPYEDIRAKRLPEEDKYLFEGKYQTQDAVDWVIKDRDYREDLRNTLKASKDRECYIYSDEWNMWWRTDSNGYTNDKSKAGSYKVEKAVNIALRCGIRKGLRLVLT